MRISESQLRRIICQEARLALQEGVFDGNLGAGRPATPSAAEKASTQATELALSKKMADSGAKKLSPAIKDEKAAISKADPEELKKMVKNWGKAPEGAEEEKKAETPQASTVMSKITQAATAQPGAKPTPVEPKDIAPATPEKPFEKQSQQEKMKSAAKVSAAALRLSQSNGGQARDMAKIIKDNPAVRTAFAMTPGMADIQASVDANLKARGKDPLTSVGDAWRELGQMTSRYGLAEGRRRWIAQELRVARSQKE
jgi:hypothetical protein